MSKSHLYTDPVYLEEKFEATRDSIKRVHRRVDKLDQHIDTRMDTLELLIKASSTKAGSPKLSSYAINVLMAAIIAGMFNLIQPFANEAAAKSTKRHYQMDSQVRSKVKIQ